MQPLPCKISGKINEYDRAAASEAKNGRLEKQPYIFVFGEEFETFLTS